MRAIINDRSVIEDNVYQETSLPEVEEKTQAETIDSEIYVEKTVDDTRDEEFSLVIEDTICEEVIQPEIEEEGHEETIVAMAEHQIPTSIQLAESSTDVKVSTQTLVPMVFEISKEPAIGDLLQTAGKAGDKLNLSVREKRPNAVLNHKNQIDTVHHMLQGFISDIGTIKFLYLEIIGSFTICFDPGIIYESRISLGLCKQFYFWLGYLIRRGTLSVIAGEHKTMTVRRAHSSLLVWVGYHILGSAIPSNTTERIMQTDSMSLQWQSIFRVLYPKAQMHIENILNTRHRVVDSVRAESNVGFDPGLIPSLLCANKGIFPRNADAVIVVSNELIEVEKFSAQTYSNGQMDTEGESDQAKEELMHYTVQGAQIILLMEHFQELHFQEGSVKHGSDVQMGSYCILTVSCASSSTQTQSFDPGISLRRLLHLVGKSLCCRVVLPPSTTISEIIFLGVVSTIQSSYSFKASVSVLQEQFLMYCSQTCELAFCGIRTRTILDPHSMSVLLDGFYVVHIAFVKCMTSLVIYRELVTTNIIVHRYYLQRFSTTTRDTQHSSVFTTTIEFLMPHKHFHGSVKDGILDFFISNESYLRQWTLLQYGRFKFQYCIYSCFHEFFLLLQGSKVAAATQEQNSRRQCRSMAALLVKFYAFQLRIIRGTSNFTACIGVRSVHVHIIMILALITGVFDPGIVSCSLKNAKCRTILHSGEIMGDSIFLGQGVACIVISIVSTIIRHHAKLLSQYRGDFNSSAISSVLDSSFFDAVVCVSLNGLIEDMVQLRVQIQDTKPTFYGRFQAHNFQRQWRWLIMVVIQGSSAYFLCVAVVMGMRSLVGSRTQVSNGECQVLATILKVHFFSWVTVKQIHSVVVDSGTDPGILLIEGSVASRLWQIAWGTVLEFLAANSNRYTCLVKPDFSACTLALDQQVMYYVLIKISTGDSLSIWEWTVCRLVNKWLVYNELQRKDHPLVWISVQYCATSYFWQYYTTYMSGISFAFGMSTSFVFLRLFIMTFNLGIASELSPGNSLITELASLLSTFLFYEICLRDQQATFPARSYVTINIMMFVSECYREVNVYNEVAVFYFGQSIHYSFTELGYMVFFNGIVDVQLIESGFYGKHFQFLWALPSVIILWMIAWTVGANLLTLIPVFVKVIQQFSSLHNGHKQTVEINYCVGLSSTYPKASILVCFVYFIWWSMSSFVWRIAWDSVTIWTLSTELSLRTRIVLKGKGVSCEWHVSKSTINM